MRLELTRRGDYAIRAMLALAARSAALPVSAPVIAADTGVPPAFLPQVMADLVHAGLVEARLGRSGGYRLGRLANAISLLEIVEAVEGDSRRRTCVLRGGSCNAQNPCAVHDAFFSAQEALLATLAGATLDQLATRFTPQAGVAMREPSPSASGGSPPPTPRR
jgi:Rrf2 family transcriptional regulator, iron-sulfur cluster assembly transcription factor